MGRADCDALLQFLPALAEPGPANQETWPPLQQDAQGAFLLTGPEYPPLVRQFIHYVGHSPWNAFDYDLHAAGERIRDPQAIATATLRDVRHMLTYVLRGERFCDGHVGACIASGQVGAILRRVAQLRDTLPESAQAR